MSLTAILTMTDREEVVHDLTKWHHLIYQTSRADIVSDVRDT